MFEFAWPWIFALLPLPWLMRIVLPVADSGEPALKVSFLGDLEGLVRRRARANLPAWRQQAPFILLWLLLLVAAARLAAEEGVKIYPIGIGADPEQSGTLGFLGLNPSLDLDEPALKAIAEATGGRYFRARDSQELQAIKDTLDQLEPVAQQPTQARSAQALYSWPLAAALLLSILLVVRERWPEHPLQRFFTRERFLQPLPDWRERLKRLRLRRRR